MFRFGRWWTIFSAGWLHGGLLHIFFNLMWVRQLAPETAELYGPGRTVIIYTVAGAAGFALSSVMGSCFRACHSSAAPPFTVGASAPIFGLLGALVCYGRRTGSSHIGGTAWQYAVILFVFGLFMNAVDNHAHAGGFVGGYAAALAARSLEARARGSPDRRAGLPRHHGGRGRRIAHHQLRAAS